jgi:YaiO family outer membrane protein
VSSGFVAIIAALICVIPALNAAQNAPNDTIEAIRRDLAADRPARAERRAIEALALDPDNPALLNVHAEALRELNRKTEARDVVRRVLVIDPTNQDARRLLHLLERDLDSSEVTVGATYDRFEAGSSWRESEIAVRRNTTFGVLLARAARARRFGIGDDQLAIEAFPRFSSRSYGYFAVGWSPSARLYPRSRFAAEAFQSLGSGFEASAGYRRLNFADGANLFTGTVSKYVHDWVFTARMYRAAGVPDQTTAVTVAVRRYFGSGSEYVGFRLGRGASRDEVRSLADLQALDSRDVAAEGLFEFRDRWLLNVRAGAGRVDVGGGRDVRHVSFAGSAGMRF